MAHIYKVEVATGTSKVFNVIAENEDEARAKVQATLTVPEETIKSVVDDGEVTQ